MICTCLAICGYSKYFVLKVNIFFFFKRGRKGSGNSKLEAFIFLTIHTLLFTEPHAFVCKEPSWPDVGLAAVHCYAGVFTGNQTPYLQISFSSVTTVDLKIVIVVQ